MKTVIGFKDGLSKSFKQVLYRIDNWINEGAARTIEYIEENTLIFLFIIHYQEVHILNCVIN